MNWQMAFRLVVPVIAGISVLSLGCGARTGDEPLPKIDATHSKSLSAGDEPLPKIDATRSESLSADKVLAIARDAVAANDTWVSRAEFETPTKQADGSWSVLVWRLPMQPGGHRVVIINAKGEVTEYIRGA